MGTQPLIPVVMGCVHILQPLIGNAPVQVFQWEFHPLPQCRVHQVEIWEGSWLHFVQISAPALSPKGNAGQLKSRRPHLILAHKQWHWVIELQINYFRLFLCSSYLWFCLCLKKTGKIQICCVDCCWFLEFMHWPLEQNGVNRQMRGKRLLFFLSFDIAERFPLVTQ